MRVTVIEPDGAGGMAHYAYMLCNAMADQGADVTLVTTTDYELGDLPHSFQVDRRLNLWSRTAPHRRSENRFATFLHTAWRRSTRAIRLFAQWWKAVSAVTSDPPDVIQLRPTAMPAAPLMMWRMRRSGAALSSICHEFEGREGTGFRAEVLNGFLYLKAYDRFDALFFHGESNRTKFLQQHDIPSDRAHLIIHGNGSLFQLLDVPADEALRRRYDIGSEDRVALFFGSVRPSKGVETLLEAMANVDESRRLVVAGPTSVMVDPAELQERLETLGLPERVTFDFRYIPNSEVGSLMRLADVVVFPYLNATQSGPMEIAFSYGKPVVATDVGAFAETVEDGVTGLVVPPSDPNALAAAIDKILGDDSLAARMGEAASAASKSRSWSHPADRIVKVYEHLTAG